MRELLVAPLSPSCRICQLDEDARNAANDAIWKDGSKERVRQYRAAAVKALLDLSFTVDPKTVGRHADHIERSWRTATPAAPPRALEVPIWTPSVDSLAERAGMLGHAAMSDLERRVSAGIMEDKDVIAVAKLGVGAAVAREKIVQRRREADINVAAIFGIVSGHVVTPPHEVKNVTPVEELEAELDAERALLREA
jgi:hypothetical protein